MPVDKKILESCIIEAAEGDTEFADYLRTKYAANDALAAKFVGGFMRSSDYTKKTQELSQQRTQYESQASQLETVRKALEAAETEKNTILQDLAKHRVSTAKARELMLMLREKYNLDDNDLPGMSDLIETAKKGKVVDSTDDLDTRFKTFGESLMKEFDKKFAGAMGPELGAMATLPIIWGEIGREHEELTGKRLSFAEQQEIYKEAREGKGSLRDVWEQKYGIAGDDGLRMKKRDEGLRKNWEQDREKSDAERRQKQALEVVTPAATDLGNGPGISAAFKTKFRTYDSDPNAQGGGVKPGNDGVPALSVLPGQHAKQIGDRGPSGAQRAAAKHLEKLQTGGYSGRKAS